MTAPSTAPARPASAGRVTLRWQSPLPDQLRRLRLASAITTAQAADIVLVARRTWQQWEAGDRAMPPGLWLLFQIILAELARDRGRRALRHKSPPANEAPK